MKKISILIISFLMLSMLSTFAQIPNKFTLEEEVISLGTCFKISGVNGEIQEKIISWTASFKTVINGKVMSSSKQKMFSFGSKIDIFNASGKKIGMVEEQVFESFFSPIYTKYIIYDANNKQVAFSEKHQLLATQFTVKDNKGKTICLITRPAINFISDTWDVKFYNTTLDKSLFIYIPCYKTFRDNEEARKNN